MANNICSDKLEKHNSEDENTSKQGELSKQLDDENLQKITKNTKNSPPLSRQGCLSLILVQLAHPNLLFPVNNSAEVNWCKQDITEHSLDDGV
jgi:hypothetical protein